MKIYSGGYSVEIEGGASTPESPPVSKVTIYDEGATVEVINGAPPVPMPDATRYRCDHRYLFQHVRSAREPDRIHKGDSKDLVQDGAGTGGALRVQPSGGRASVADHIDFYIGWAFDSKGKGGDIIDRLQNRNPATPVHWIQAPLNDVTSGAKRYTANATDGLQFIQQQNRWNAWSFNRTGALRAMAGVKSATPPRFDVHYTDGTNEVLACRVTAMMTTATDYPYTIVNQSGLPQFDLPIVAEFERPTKPVASATLVFTIATHNTTKSTLLANIIDPPMNIDPVTLGVAQQAGIADAGLWNVPSIINAQQFLDTLPDSEWFDWSGPQNTDDEKNYSPEMYWPEHTGNPVPGPYNPDLTKYPHRSSPEGGKHKWIGMTAAQAATQFHRVPSTYDKEGFEPLLPGHGALRVFLPQLPGIKDGTIETSSSYQTVQARIFLPAKLWGQRRVFTRFYIRVGTPTRQGPDPLGPPDVPFRSPIAERFQVFNSSGHWIWSDLHGKNGIVPQQVTGYGGYSGTAGGTGGNQFRLSFGHMTSADDGPDVGGISLGWHLYDYGARNPPGYQYNGDSANLTQFGQRGGQGGVLFGNVWYCIETEVLYNTVRDSSGNIVPGGYLPDGELRVWGDGRLWFERKGMVFRALHQPTGTPPESIYSYGGSKWGSMSFVDPGYNKALRRQARDLGAIEMTCNHYHGGVTQCPINLTWFYSLIAYGTQRIGPARLQ